MILDQVTKKITWTFDIRRHELPLLEKLLWKLPRGKYAALTKMDANSISTNLQRKEVIFFNLFNFYLKKKKYSYLCNITTGGLT